jgi:argininosuccinate lyase
MSEKPWDGRFAERTDTERGGLYRLHQTDKRLYPYDIEGSMAHCRMLAKVGVISDEEADAAGGRAGAHQARTGSGQVPVRRQPRRYPHAHRGPPAAGCGQSRPEAAHRPQPQRPGGPGCAHVPARCHPGGHQANWAIAPGAVDLAEQHIDVVMPGYTHLQRAQPVLLAHHWMAYYEMFTRDAERFRRQSRSAPMSCRWGPRPWPAPPIPSTGIYTAELLGFPAIAPTAWMRSSDRDFIIEFLAAASICMVHLSRMSEELVLWSSAEFRFIELPDAFATGSSIMPQKKNPRCSRTDPRQDRPGLRRSDRHADLDEIPAAEPTTATCRKTKRRCSMRSTPCKAAWISPSKCCPRSRIKSETMRQAASIGFLNATDLADYLVAQGVPFRKPTPSWDRRWLCAGAGQGAARAVLKELQTFSKGDSAHERHSSIMPGRSWGRKPPP